MTDKSRRARYVIRLLRFAGYLPLPLAHRLGAFLGWLLWLLPNEQRRIAAINLALCFPQLADREQRRLLRQSLIESGKTFAELGPLWLWPGPRILGRIRSVSGEDAWRRALVGANGAIIVTPHLGAWEISGLYISQHYPMTAMYRPSRMGIHLDEWIKQARERLGGRYVAADAGGVRAVFQALRRGEVVGILPDQDPDKESGIFAPFFQQPAWTMVLVSKLAIKYRVPVFLIYAERLPRGQGYRLHFSELPQTVAQGSLEQSVAAMNQAIEQAVRQLPGQYLWSYKRFKTQPPGSPKPYRRRPGQPGSL